MSILKELPKTFRPMLSAKITDYPIKGVWENTDPNAPADPVHNGLRQMYKDGLFPLHCSPKLDGIRTLIHPTLGPVTRTMKEIPNRYIYEQLSRATELHGLDCEIIVGDTTDLQAFNTTQSVVMSRWVKTSVVKFTLVVFDAFVMFDDVYPIRALWANKAVQQWKFNTSRESLPWNVVMVPYTIATTPDEVLQYEDYCIEEGYEGVMLRSNYSSAGYKFNRSTAKQALLLKIKRMEDAEGIVVGAEELLHNMNPSSYDAFGLLKRSSHQARMFEGNSLGIMQVRVTTGPFKGVTVGVGSGFTAAERKKLWEDFKEDMTQADIRSGESVGKLLGQTITFKYQPHGSKDKPRIPIFKGFRND